MNTDELDDTYTSHLFTNALIKLREERDMFKRQRDELREALELLLDDVTTPEDLWVPDTPLGQARAVIAGVKS